MTKINNEDTVTSQLIREIKEALKSVKFGSIEIFIQNRIVTQITVRNIRKTSVGIDEEQKNKTSNIPSKLDNRMDSINLKRS